MKRTRRRNAVVQGSGSRNRPGGIVAVATFGGFRDHHPVHALLRKQYRAISICSCSCIAPRFEGLRVDADRPVRIHAEDGSSYYYLRARQADGHLVWLSPVWVDE
jgi:hypothetical protein